MATPESKVKKEVKKILEKYNVYYFCPLGSMFGRSGIPDIIACHQGKFIAIECKAGNNKPTALQQKELNDIHQHFGATYVLNESNLDVLENDLLISTKYDLCAAN